MRDAAGGSKADAVMRVAPSDLRGVIRSIVHGLADDDQALPLILHRLKQRCYGCRKSGRASLNMRTLK